MLYLFRTLPIPVPKSFFSQAQSILNKYIWQGKKARCVFSRIVILIKAGGVGHTHRRDYHTAIILTKLKEWLVPEPATLWAQLEQHQVIGGNLYNYLITSPFIPHPQTDTTPTIQASIEAWRNLHKDSPSKCATTPVKVISLRFFPSNP